MLGPRNVALLVLSVAAAAGAAASGCSSDEESAPLTPEPPREDAGRDVVSSPSDLCPGGKPVDWPPAPYAVEITGTVPPDLSFTSATGTVRIKDYFEPCAQTPRLLVVRTSAAWCGTCAWHLGHTKRLLDDPRFAGRIVLLDLLVADEDNMPATLPALERFRGRIDAPQGLAIDPSYTFRRALLSTAPLPEYVLIDTRAMVIRSSIGDPDPETLANRIMLELASLDKKPRPDLATPTLYDGMFSENQIDVVRGMKLVAAPPPDPTNEYGDVPAAVTLGKQLFSDPLLSPSGQFSCATCHAPDKSFADGVPQSVGVSKVDRNSPAIALAAHARWQFWDGRADTLWMQALGPPENPKEIGSSRLYIAHQIAQRYAASYASVFGAKYPLPASLETDPARFPASGKPGDAAWAAMAQADRDAVTRIYVNVGKAIAAFERSLRVKPSALDRYIDGDLTALTPPQKKALRHFLVSGCAQCHWGPRLTDDAFHVIRFATGRQDGAPDRGRIDVLAGLAGSEFVATSMWSDAPSLAKPLAFAAEPSMLGAFKTPTLRGVVATPPYGHGGTFQTVLEVTQHYGRRGDDVKDPLAVGVVEPWVPNFDANIQAEMVPIFDAFDAEIAP